mmetsp:Transcript_7004/g.16405  ORF Transcript_7004/g.16405 Transcript_7004/m.16405 type:complete len:134 (+) Transcript_7004:397-798(+)
MNQVMKEGDSGSQYFDSSLSIWNIKRQSTHYWRNPEREEAIVGQRKARFRHIKTAVICNDEMGPCLVNIPPSLVQLGVSNLGIFRRDFSFQNDTSMMISATSGWRSVRTRQRRLSARSIPGATSRGNILILQA